MNEDKYHVEIRSGDLVWLDGWHDRFGRGTYTYTSEEAEAFIAAQQRLASPYQYRIIKA